MKRISIRLMVALLTFAAGIAVSALWLLLRSPHTNSSDSHHVDYRIGQFPQSSKYENPATHDGLFYVARSSDGYIIDSSDGYDERQLVLSYDDKPIEPKANDPDAPTFPGFYLSYKVRFDFERVEVIGKKVYFKTRGVGGIHYEFTGTSGEEVIPNFNPSTRVPFIKGILKKLREGEVITEEEIKFRLAVIA